MNSSEFSGLFCDIFAQNHLEIYCTPEIIEKFEAFTAILCEENAHTNLTAIREIPDIIAKHYADCLLAAEFYPEHASVMDMGCGGGLPTFPLAIARPDLTVTAVDSTAKKIRFVEAAAKKLGLTRIVPVCARAEDPSMKKYRESFDIVTSRAMANMSVLSELALPYVKVGGQLIALKGLKGSEELAEAKSAIQKLGGKPIKDMELTLQTGSEAEKRHILIIGKASKTAPQYPRQYASILKKPL